MITRENPARFDEIVGAVPRTSPVEIDAVVEATDTDSRRWAATPVEERLAFLTAGAEALEDALGDLSVLLARETGKVLGDCRAEIGLAVRVLRRTAAAVDPRSPTGVVAVLTPWIAPVALAALKIAPALAAGNAVVLKPSPLAPLTVDRVVRLLGGPLRIVHGGAETATALLSHPLIRGVASATPGSGLFPAAHAATLPGDSAALPRDSPALPRDSPALPRDSAALPRDSAALLGDQSVVLLGDAAFDDAAMDRLALATGRLGRIFVPTRRLPDFVDTYRMAADRVLVTGDPLADGVTMGPVISAATQEVAANLRRGTFFDLGIFDADEKTGYYVRPTLLVPDQPPAAGPLAPIVSVICYDDEDAVIDMANAGELGAGIEVHSADAGRAAGYRARVLVPSLVRANVG